MKRLYWLFVMFFFLAAVGAVAQEDAQAEGNDRTEGGGNTWFNLRPAGNPWYVGLYGGYANNNLYQGGAEHSRPGKVWENGHGWTFGILARFQIFNWLAAQTETVFITKNYGYYYHASGNKLYNDTTNNFVEFPLLLSLSIRPEGGGWATGLRLYANAGGFLGVWAASRETGQNLSASSENPTYQYDKDYEFDDRRDNRFEYGLAAGAGVQYEINWASVFIEFRYNHGLSDLQQAYQYKLVPQMNSTWTVQMGFLVNTGKVKQRKTGAKR
jgi:hypothetical protein